MSEIFKYKTISSSSESIFCDRASKFLAYAYPVRSRKEVELRLEELKALHPKSRHHCFAFRLGSSGNDYRISDDGEPAGSAGQPIYGQLLSFEVTNVLVVVIRYFGGTKLGISGLINAYKTSTYDALSKVVITTKTRQVFYQISATYEKSAQLMNAFQRMEFVVERVAYDERAVFHLALPLENHEEQMNRAIQMGFGLQAASMAPKLTLSDIDVYLKTIES